GGWHAAARAPVRAPLRGVAYAVTGAGSRRVPLHTETMGIAAALVAVFTLSSPAFGNGGMIPARYTCDGANVSPALRWSLPPAGTRSFTLTMQDPDVPQGTFVHWNVTGIPARTRSLPVGAHPAHEDLNDFGKRGYSGPCPPRGETHHYIFLLRAI